MTSQSNDQNVGSSAGGGSNSLSGIISTLVPVLLVALVMTALFLILRRSQRRIYQPRTFISALRPQYVAYARPPFLWLGRDLTLE